MGNLAQHINPNLFNSDVETAPNRNGYGDGLKEAGEADARVVALSADLTSSTKTNVFAEAFPQRFVQVGIAEQSMASVAAGMAAMGKIPFFASYAAFSPGRNWEQIRTTIAYNGTNVKIIGAHAGVSVGPDGATHQALEDIATMRIIPRMVVIAPCDYHEAKKATLAMAKYVGPAYMRLAREASPTITTPATPFIIGKANLMKDGKDAVIIACGIMVAEALAAAEVLKKDGIDAAVINMHTIKPLDKEAIVLWAKKTGAIVTAEEHQLIGGLGSAVSEVLSMEFPVPMEMIGVKDSFGESGEPEELMEKYGLKAWHIVIAVKRVIKRKK